VNVVYPFLERTGIFPEGTKLGSHNWPMKKSIITHSYIKDFLLAVIEKAQEKGVVQHLATGVKICAKEVVLQDRWIKGAAYFFFLFSPVPEFVFFSPPLTFPLSLSLSLSLLRPPAPIFSEGYVTKDSPLTKLLPTMKVKSSEYASEKTLINKALKQFGHCRIAS